MVGVHAPEAEYLGRDAHVEEIRCSISSAERKRTRALPNTWTIVCTLARLSSSIDHLNEPTSIETFTCWISLFFTVGNRVEDAGIHSLMFGRRPM